MSQRDPHPSSWYLHATYSLMAQLLQVNSNHNSELICLPIRLLSFEKRSKTGSLLFSSVFGFFSISSTLSYKVNMEAFFVQSFWRFFPFSLSISCQSLSLAHSSTYDFFFKYQRNVDAHPVTHTNQCKRTTNRTSCFISLNSNWDIGDFYPVFFFF